MIREWLLKKAEAVMASRPPDFEVGPPGDRYMLRWHLTPWSTFKRGTPPKNFFDALKRKLPGVYLHSFLHDDEDAALHDHPFASASFILKTGYWEVLFTPIRKERIAELQGVGLQRPIYKTFRKEGSVTFRGARSCHRIVVVKVDGKVPPTITLFVCGFRVRDWGFACARGWKHWKEFVGERDYGTLGRGCGED